MEPKFILVTGNPFDGLNVYGPFDDTEEASEWACEEFKTETWWVQQLTTPEYSEE